MSDIKIEDLSIDMTIADEDINHVKGGLVGLLLPAVQKVRESEQIEVLSWSWGETNSGSY